MRTPVVTEIASQAWAVTRDTFIEDLGPRTPAGQLSTDQPGAGSPDRVGLLAKWRSPRAPTEMHCPRDAIDDVYQTAPVSTHTYNRRSRGHRRSHPRHS